MKFITEEEIKFQKELKEMVKKYPTAMVKGKRKHPKHIVTLAAKIKLYRQYEQQLPIFKETAEKETDSEKKIKMQKRIAQLEDLVATIPSLVAKFNLNLIEYTQVNKNKKRLAKLKKKGYNKKRVGFEMNKQKLPKEIRL